MIDFNLSRYIPEKTCHKLAPLFTTAGKNYKTETTRKRLYGKHISIRIFSLLRKKHSYKKKTFNYKNIFIIFIFIFFCVNNYFIIE